MYLLRQDIQDKLFPEKPEKEIIASGDPESSYHGDIEIQDLFHELGFLFDPFGDLEAIDILYILTDGGHEIIQVISDLSLIDILEDGDDVFVHTGEKFLFEMPVIRDICDEVFKRRYALAESGHEDIQDFFVEQLAYDRIRHEKHIRIHKEIFEQDVCRQNVLQNLMFLESKNRCLRAVFLIRYEVLENLLGIAFEFIVKKPCIKILLIAGMLDQEIVVVLVGVQQEKKYLCLVEDGLFDILEYLLIGWFACLMEDEFIKREKDIDASIVVELLILRREYFDPRQEDEMEEKHRIEEIEVIFRIILPEDIFDIDRTDQTDAISYICRGEESVAVEAGCRAVSVIEIYILGLDRYVFPEADLEFEWIHRDIKKIELIILYDLPIDDGKKFLRGDE